MPILPEYEIFARCGAETAEIAERAERLEEARRVADSAGISIFWRGGCRFCRNSHIGLGAHDTRLAIPLETTMRLPILPEFAQVAVWGAVFAGI